MPVQLVTKRIGQGSPDVLDVILNGTVAMVINTPGLAYLEQQQGFAIRRAAVERGIPCLTSIDTAVAMAAAMAGTENGFNVLPLQIYRQGCNHVGDRRVRAASIACAPTPVGGSYADVGCRSLPALRQRADATGDRSVGARGAR